MDFNFDLTSLVSPMQTAVPYVAVGLLGLYLLMGGILDYHWRRYGVGLLNITRFRVLYLAAGIILFGVLFVATASL